MQEFSLKTAERCQMVKIDGQINAALSAAGWRSGLLTVFTPHTTAAITINENADPDVCHDWIENLNRLVPAAQSYYRHGEGNSDSHVKSSLVGAAQTVIVESGKIRLGTWQSVYFCEFDGPRTRQVWLKFVPC